MKKIFLYLVGALLLTTSCEKTIEFKGEITDPLLVINTYIVPDSTLSVYINKSSFFLNESDFFPPRGVKVELWVNGNFKEELRHTPSENTSLFKGSYKPQIGDYLHFRATAPGFKDAKSDEIVLLKPSPFQNLTLSSFIPCKSDYCAEGTLYDDHSFGGYNTPIGTYKGGSVIAYLDVVDPSPEANYFRLTASCVNVLINGTDTSYNSVYASISYVDPIFGNTNTDDEFGLVSESENTRGLFSDRLFDQKRYRVKVELSNIPYYTLSDPNWEWYNEITLYLEHIDYAYYMYYKTLDATDGAVLMTEPVQIYSNIQDGIGVVCSGTMYQEVIRMGSSQ